MVEPSTDIDSKAAAGAPGLGAASAFDAITTLAMAFLRSRFGRRVETCLSAGVIGSCATNEQTLTSDLDFYLVFDLQAFEREGVNLAEADLSETVRLLTEHVQGGHDSPLARRFSVYWSSLACLREGSHAIGRWPAYDRHAFRHGGRHLLGKVISKAELAPVSHADIVEEGARFLLDVVKGKLESASWFRHLDELDAAGLEGVDALLYIKATTMPVRMSYVLGATEPARVVVSTEIAVERAGVHLGRHAFWELVQAALRWRITPPESEALSEVAGALRMHLRALYAFVLGEYAVALLQLGKTELAQALHRWRTELEAGGASAGHYPR